MVYVDYSRPSLVEGFTKNTFIAMIEGVVKRIDAECGRQLTVVATGGLAPLFMEHTAAIDHIDSDLTIRGLQMIHKRNRKP